MNLRTLYLLAGLLGVALLVFALTQIFKYGRPDKDGDWVLPALHEKGAEVKSSDIDRVEVERRVPGTDRRETLAFARGADGWEMEQPSKLRVQGWRVDGLVDSLIRARREKSELTANLDQYDLRNPPVEVTLRKGDQSWKLQLSNKPSISGGVVYGLIPGTKEPMAIKYSDVDDLYLPVNDYRSQDLLAASTQTATALELQPAKGDEVVLEKSDDGAWHFKKPPYGPADYEGESPAFGTPPAASKGVTGVRELLDAVTALRVEDVKDFVADGVSDAELASKYGLASDKPETLRVTVKAAKVRGEGEKKTTETLLIGKKVDLKDEKKEGDKPEAKGEYYYVRVAGESAVARVPAAKVEPLLKVLASPDALRDRGLVQADAGRKDKIDAVNVQVGGDLVKLRKADETTWKLYRGGAGDATEPGSVRELLDALTEKKQVKTFVDKEDGLEFDKPSAVVSLWFDGVEEPEKKDPENKDEKKEEKKDDGEPKLKSEKPALTLTFGKRDRDKGVVYVRRESAEGKSVVTVADGLLDKVTVGPLTFLDRKLPTFSEGIDAGKDVTKVVLDRGGQTWELAKEKEGEKSVWKFLQPEGMKGRTADEFAVSSLLRDLGTLRADKLIAEKPSESDLDFFGLKTPQTKATVTVTKDGKSEDWVYTFGREEEVALPGEKDKAKVVYGKTDRRDVVFAVRGSRLSGLQGDLRDPTVFNFDVAKVKGVKITGWQALTGVAITLDLERKGDKQWEAKAPPGFNVDADAVDSFVRTLSHLRAERFVKPKVGVDTGLDVGKGALQIEVTVEGEEKPLVLTVGAEDPDNKMSYFARSSRQEGDVFLVPKFGFEKAREKPAFFAKK
jgi:hypothetical protein